MELVTVNARWTFSHQPCDHGQQQVRPTGSHVQNLDAATSKSTNVKSPHTHILELFYPVPRFKGVIDWKDVPKPYATAVSVLLFRSRCFWQQWRWDQHREAHELEGITACIFIISSTVEFLMQRREWR